MTAYIKIYDYPKETLVTPGTQQVSFSPWLPILAILLLFSWYLIKYYMSRSDGARYTSGNRYGPCGPPRNDEDLEQEFNEWLESCVETYRTDR